MRSWDDIGDRWDIRDRWDIGDSRRIVSGVEQAGMVGGGIETTGGRGQFSGHMHALQHFASCIVVVAGGLEDVRDAVGSGAVV